MTDYGWPAGKRVALSIVVNVEEGSEMSVARGDKRPEPVDELGVAVSAPIRNYVNESNYLYGIRAGAPRIFRVLDRHGATCTVTAAAQALEDAPELAATIRERGYEICAHGWRWVHQFSMDEDRERDFIARAARSIEATTGARPQGWLSRYLHTPATRRLLVEEGYSYHMDDLSDDLPRWEDVEGGGRLVVVPYALDTNDMKFWTAPAYGPSDWLDYARRSLDWLCAEAEEEGPRMMSVGLHLRVIGRPGRIGALDAFLADAASRGEVWFAQRGDIARRFVAANPR